MVIMMHDDGFTVFVFLCWLVFFTLFCAFKDTNQSSWEHSVSQKVCAKNEGYQELSSDLVGYSVRCKDGAVFDFDNGEFYKLKAEL